MFVHVSSRAGGLVRRSPSADVIGEIIEDYAAVSRTRW
ncbi:hypothetical protein Rhow_001496 [Rhodococcus wratislaviensis]|uniref:Uncharacterized protein n=1 Tax=Rhodococcus wratislaviensis TaxID=44752 RepID=A0A402C469_RHOWR|nr:hypothetical protein Rhow_001496 [Rhodococcus wratislaviensis]